MLYQSKENGKYMRLLTKRKSNINTFLEVDCNNNPIVKKRTWSTKPEMKRFVISGFSKIKLLKQ